MTLAQSMFGNVFQRFVESYAAGILIATTSQPLFGENGKEVHGCQCRGPKGTHGHCGYHVHPGLGGDADKPWCRTLHGCGFPSALGSWMECDARAVERRRANDGKLYSAKDFRRFFGTDPQKWNAAKPYVEMKMAQNGLPYTVKDFRDYYINSHGEQGWFEKWLEAQPERRKAEDGSEYNWDDFLAYYGKDKGWTKWEQIGPKKL